MQKFSCKSNWEVYHNFLKWYSMYIEGRKHTKTEQGVLSFAKILRNGKISQLYILAMITIQSDVC